MERDWWKNPVLDTAFRAFCRTFGAEAIREDDGYHINSDYDDVACLPELFESSVLTDEMFAVTLKTVH